MSELFLKIIITHMYNIYTISHNQIIYTNIHIHITISVDLLALSRHSNLLFSTFCFHFFRALFVRVRAGTYWHLFFPSKEKDKKLFVMYIINE